jgi:hypothetical protein
VRCRTHLGVDLGEQCRTLIHARVILPTHPEVPAASGFARQVGRGIAFDAERSEERSDGCA